MVTSAERLSTDALAPGDTILVRTSGHSPGSPDALALVLEVRREQRVLHVRLSGGRHLWYAAGASVRRLPARR